MSDTHDVPSMVSAAEAAAASGDYVTAEQRLREAARLQEDQLGPVHPDLANTLNNLGIVNEILAKPAEAEASFRRAVAIATASLAPDHPFVLTSRKNLADFCAARGIPVGRPITPAPPPAPAAGAGAPTAPSAQPARAAAPAAAASKPATPVAAAPVAKPAAAKPATPSAATPGSKTAAPPVPGATGSHRRSALGVAGILIGGLIVAIVVMRGCSGPDTGAASGDGAQPQASAETAPPTQPAGAPAPRTDPPAAAAGRETAPPTAPPEPARKPAVPPVPAPFPSATGRANASAASPGIVDARLCRQLATSGGWQCTALPDPVGPGPVYYYTRVRSPRNTTVAHRWYRGDTLMQSVELSIGSNTAEGYRTYSRQTMDSRSTGAWRVEMRSADGAVLHEQRFVVK